jgi:ubiquinone/menaquinone biosynthesis C-methylase UbiE
MNMFTLIAPFYDTLMKAVHKRQGTHLLDELAPWDGKAVLDVGGGTGRLAAQMMESGADVWLLDTSVQMLRRAQQVLPKERCILGNATAMTFQDRMFDAVITVDAIHHIRAQEKMLAETFRVLTPGGVFAVLDFSPDSPRVRTLARLERLVGEPALFLTPAGLDDMLKAKGFTRIKSKPLSAHEYLTTAIRP